MGETSRGSHGGRCVVWAIDRAETTPERIKVVIQWGLLSVGTQVHFSSCGTERFIKMTSTKRSPKLHQKDLYLGSTKMCPTAA